MEDSCHFFDLHPTEGWDLRPHCLWIYSNQLSMMDEAGREASFRTRASRTAAFSSRLLGSPQGDLPRGTQMKRSAGASEPWV